MLKVSAIIIFLILIYLVVFKTCVQCLEAVLIIRHSISPIYYYNYYLQKVGRGKGSTGGANSGILYQDVIHDPALSDGRLKKDKVLKGLLYPEPKIVICCALSQNYQHLFE